MDRVLSRVSILACALLWTSFQAAALDPLHLQYRASWRTLHAGNAQLLVEPGAGSSGGQARLTLKSVGMVDSLYNVEDDYTVSFDSRYCAGSSLFMVQEGRKHRRIAVTYQSPPGKASYLERDLKKDEIVNQREIDIPACVHDEISALFQLRDHPLRPGESTQLPISNGKKFASVRVEAQRRERVETPGGAYDAIRYEAFLYRDVIYRRNARMWFWLSDDERRLPVQIRIDLGFLLGTVTLKLEKQEPV